MSARRVRAALPGGTRHPAAPEGAPPDRSQPFRALPLAERPRDRLRRLGPEALSVAELLSLVVGTGCRGRSSLDVSYELLDRAEQSLRALASQSTAALTATSGVGLVRALTILAALELGRRRCAEVREEGAPLRSPEDVYAVYGPRLAGLTVEEFHVAVLDSQHRLERDVTVTRGVLDESLINPRKVFREAIVERAAAVILVHNHPSGDPTPSAEDRVATEQLVAAGRLLDIPVHDHIVIGRKRFESLAERGWI